MADRLDISVRSSLMSRIRSRDTTPEMVVRRTAHGLGLRFRLHRGSLPGCPDLVMPKHHSVVFVHGCFWHGHSGCRRSGRPTSNVSFWNQKLDGNVRRDKRNIRKLRNLGWRVLVIWECQTRQAGLLRTRIAAFFAAPECSVGGRNGG